MPNNPDFARVVDDPCDKHALVLMVNGEGIHWADKSEFNRESLGALAIKLNAAFQSALAKRVGEETERNCKAICGRCEAGHLVVEEGYHYIKGGQELEPCGAIAIRCEGAIRSRKGKGD